MSRDREKPRPLDPAAFYDRVAPLYDQRYAHPQAYTALQAAWLARVLPPGRVLDLGCGTGRMLGPLARAGYRPVGLDCSSGMLARARAKHPRLPLVRARAEQGLAFASACFSGVICLHGTLIHLGRGEQLAGVLSEAHRVLAPGGVLVLELPQPHLFPGPEAAGRWQKGGVSLSYLRLDRDSLIMRLDDLEGLATAISLVEPARLQKWLAPFARVEFMGGFWERRATPRRGELLVVCAWKGS